MSYDGPIRWFTECHGDRVRIEIRKRETDDVLMRVDLPPELAKGIGAGLIDIADQAMRASALGVCVDQPEKD